MAIPKVIYQTFKTVEIPLFTKLHIWWFRRKNKNYRYEFYDDKRVTEFIQNNFDERTYKAYSRLQIGAAKADFFRYAVLYTFGGVYVDLDSAILVKLDDHIYDTDVAVITREKRHQNIFAQWGLIYDKGHPFLQKTLEIIISNIENNSFPNDVHGMTGPTPYTKAVETVIKENPEVAYRI
ncbi:MAG: glycosyl transferase, partial [Chitinophagaceae bacterium]